MRTSVAIWGLVGALLAPPVATAQTECPADDGRVQGADEVDVDRFQLLRQLTLDLWGSVPSEADAAALVDGEISSGTIEAMVDDPRFLDYFVSRYHRDLLWPSLEVQDLTNVAISLLLPAIFYEDSGDPWRLYLLYPALVMRGGFVPCKDEPATWDDDGELVFEDMPDGTRREGFVMVEPYWAPGTEVKVCALEARIDPVTPTGQSCATPEGLFSGSCGCGPGLMYCLSPDSAAMVEASLRQQALRMMDTPIRDGGSYFDGLTTRYEELDGPLIHYYRHQVKMALDPIIAVPPVPVGALPADVSFVDPTWRSFERSPEHSGILTSLSYLLRFQSDRSRAARFYEAFACQPFEAPEADLPSPADECSEDPNLRTRCGCGYCHAVLEPATAYWARFAEAGAMYLTPFAFPDVRQDCAACAETGGPICENLCNRFYLTEAGHPDLEPWLGTLDSLVFRADKELEWVEQGPAGLVADMLQSDRLPTCTTERVFERLFRRPPTENEREDLLPMLTQDFASSGYDFKALVKRIVTDPGYARMVQ